MQELPPNVLIVTGSIVYCNTIGISNSFEVEEEGEQALEELHFAAIVIGCFCCKMCCLKDFSSTIVGNIHVCCYGNNCVIDSCLVDNNTDAVSNSWFYSFIYLLLMYVCDCLDNHSINDYAHKCDIVHSDYFLNCCYNSCLIDSCLNHCLDHLSHYLNYHNYFN